MYECQVEVKIQYHRKIKCSRMWDSFFFLIKHMKKDHPTEVKRHCLSCELFFSSKEEEEMHAYSCPNKFKCENCHKGFSSEHAKNIHNATAHPPSSLPSCEVCSKAFSKQSNLTRHMESSHGIQSSRKKVAAVRGKENVNEAEIEYFMNNSTISPYTCGVCKLTVAHNLSRLKIHQMTMCRGRFNSANEAWQAIFTWACPICCEPIRREKVQSHLRQCHAEPMRLYE